MKIHFTQGFIKRMNQIEKGGDIKNQLNKQLKLFQQDPYHPGLKLHKLKGKRSEQYAVWVKGDLRALAVREQDTYVFFDLVTHDQY